MFYILSKKIMKEENLMTEVKKYKAKRTEKLTVTL